MTKENKKEVIKNKKSISSLFEVGQENILIFTLSIACFVVGLVFYYLNLEKNNEEKASICLRGSIISIFLYLIIFFVLGYLGAKPEVYV